MEESVILVIALIATLLISYVIAEFYGKSKHIGFGWTFAISATTLFIGGIIAAAKSPSVNSEPTKGGRNYKVAAWVCFIFGGLNIIALNPMVLTFFVLGAYLLSLSKGDVRNDNPKFYFDKLRTSKVHSKSYTRTNKIELFLLTFRNRIDISLIPIAIKIVKRTI